MDVNCGIQRSARRLLVATVAACAVSIGFSAPALAQSVGSLPATGGVDTGSVLSSVTQITAPVAQSTTAPVVQSAAPVVQEAAAPLVQSAAPVHQAVALVVQAAAPVVQTAQPVLDVAAPVLEPAAPLGSSVTDTERAVSPTVTAGDASPVTHAATPPVEATSTAEGRTAASGSHSQVVPAAALVEHQARRDVGGPAGRSLHASSIPTIPRAPLQADRPSSEHASGVGSGTTAVAARRPAPNIPRGPAGFLGAVAAAFASGASLIFAAALAAALLLAAPGSGRRLRLEVASWPVPISLPSLERPG